MSRHDAEPFASGTTKPPFTNSLWSMSNSRISIASAPPRERETRQRL